MDKESKDFSRMLKFAINAGVEKAVRMQLRFLSSVDVRDKDGITPLMLAAAKGSNNICQLLLDKGADPALTDNNGYTAEDHARRKGHSSIGDLVGIGISVNYPLENIEDSVEDSLHSIREERVEDWTPFTVSICREFTTQPISKSHDEKGCDYEQAAIVDVAHAAISVFDEQESGHSAETEVAVGQKRVSGADYAINTTLEKAAETGIPAESLGYGGIASHGHREVVCEWSPEEENFSTFTAMTVIEPICPVGAFESALSTDTPSLTANASGYEVVDGEESSPEDKEGFFGWEVEPELILPEEETSCKYDAAQLQAQITRHIPIDTDEDWSHITIDLPEYIENITLFRSEHVHSRLSQFFSKAYDTGFISEHKIRAVIEEIFGAQIWKDTIPLNKKNQSQSARNLKQAARLELYAEKFEQKYLSISTVLEEMGVTVVHADVNAEAFVESTVLSEETQQSVVEALELLEQKLFNRDDPFRYYNGAIPRDKLLTKAQEIEIGIRREAGVKSIMSALSGFPALITSLKGSFTDALAEEEPASAIEKLITGIRPLDVSQPDKQRVTGPLFTDDSSEETFDEVDSLDGDYDYDSVVSWVQEFLRIIKQSNPHDLLRNHLLEVELSETLFSQLVADVQQLRGSIASLEREVLNLCSRKLKMQRRSVIDLMKSLDPEVLYGAIEELYNGDSERFELHQLHLRSLIRKLKAIASEQQLPIDAIKKQALELGRGVRACQVARDEMVNANLKLAIHIANRYQNKGLEHLDLIQEANIGLMRAADKFDYRKGYKFSTYATWWVRQAVTRAIADQARHIRVPVHMIESINRYTRVEGELRARLGRKPTVTELARELDLDEEKIRKFQFVMHMEPSGDEVDLDNFESPVTFEPEFSFDQQDLKKQVDKLLEGLIERPRKVLKMRFGIGMNSDLTLEETGKQFGVTRERIRQMESKALRTFQHSSRSGHLKVYADLSA